MSIKLNTKIPTKLKSYFERELFQFDQLYKNGHFILAWQHLERAHIIGQSYPIEHTLVHWKMFKFGIKIKNKKEVIGQIPRLLVGGIKSFVGNIPVGNPGGANVPPLKSFPIDEEIADIFKKAGLK